MNENKKPDLKKIKKIAEEFIKKITPEAEILTSLLEDQIISINIKIADAHFLIGQGSETLLAMQHLLRVILRKELDKSYYIDLDVNNYKKKRKDYLKELAVAVANEVSLARKEKTLLPMNAYERRIVHMELSVREDVCTESCGLDPERKIIIKPAS